MTFNMGYDNRLEGFWVGGKMQLGIISKNDNLGKHSHYLKIITNNVKPFPNRMGYN